MLKQLLKYIWISIIFLASAFAQDGFQDEETKKIYEEYSEITQRLNLVQQQAMEDEKISDKTKKYTEKVESKMIEQDSFVKDIIEKRDSIIGNYEVAEQTGNQDEMIKLQKEFQNVSKDLFTQQEEALQDNELKEEGKQLEEEVLNKMKEIDPKVPELIARLGSLGDKLESKKSE